MLYSYTHMGTVDVKGLKMYLLRRYIAVRQRTARVKHYITFVI